MVELAWGSGSLTTFLTNRKWKIYNLLAYKPGFLVLETTVRCCQRKELNLQHLGLLSIALQ